MLNDPTYRASVSWVNQNDGEWDSLLFVSDVSYETVMAQATAWRAQMIPHDIPSHISYLGSGQQVTR